MTKVQHFPFSAYASLPYLTKINLMKKKHRHHQIKNVHSNYYSDYFIGFINSPRTKMRTYERGSLE